ncbi:MAG: O-antigen ligase family protein [Acidobacteriota bacterium]|nr:O-antigen ligase family protein [Acidobacteriota bacterium]
MPVRPLHAFFLLGLPALVFSAFLTEIKLIPSIANNVGLFEILGGLAIVLFAITSSRRSLVGNPIINLTGFLFVAAAISLINIPQPTLVSGLIQTSILLFLFLFLLALYNLFLTHQVNPGYLLWLITLATAIVGPWILRQGFLFEGDLDAVGPFRNRAHMGIYMLTGFWLVMIYAFWPDRRRRWIRMAVTIAAIAFCLYAVAISGRRSAYFSLFLGLAALVVVFPLLIRRRRVSVAAAVAFSIGVLALLYTQGPGVLPRSEFFRSRVGLVGSRLRSATDAVSGQSTEGFMALQMQGVNAAVHAHPLIGVGWGSFHEFELNATRHEVHSTPLRFLAETGIAGLALYSLLMIHILYRSTRLLVSMRASPYAGSYLVLTVAIWSLSVSYLYNRHITERTFWLLLLVLLVLEAFAEGYRQSHEREAAALEPPPQSVSALVSAGTAFRHANGIQGSNQPPQAVRELSSGSRP